MGENIYSVLIGENILCSDWWEYQFINWSIINYEKYRNFQSIRRINVSTDPHDKVFYFFKRLDGRHRNVLRRMENGDSKLTVVRESNDDDETDELTRDLVNLFCGVFKVVIFTNICVWVSTYSHNVSYNKIIANKNLSGRNRLFAQCQWRYFPSSIILRYKLVLHWFHARRQNIEYSL